MANNLYNAIRVAHRSPTAILNLLVESYSKDYSTFAQGNNRAPLEEAIKILTGSKLDKAIALAITKGYDAGGLTTGYIGAVTGKYSAQPAETRAKYDEAIEKATAAFRVALTDSGLFAEKTEATKEEKQKAKDEREAKKEKEAAEQKAAILNAAVVAGEVVRAGDVVSGANLGDAALTDLVLSKLESRILSDDNVKAIVECLVVHSDRSLIDAVLNSLGYAGITSRRQAKSKKTPITENAVTTKNAVTA